MRENSAFIIACCLLWTSILVLVCTNESDAGFMLTLFLVPAILIGWVALLVIAISRLVRRTHLPLPKRAVPLWFATVPLLSYAAIRTGLNEITKENTWLTINQYDFSGSTNYRFMKDGEYASWRDSPLGMSGKESGRYERKDSVLTLRPKSKNGKARVLKLIIRPYSSLKKQRPIPPIRLVSLDTTARSY